MNLYRTQSTSNGNDSVSYELRRDLEILRQILLRCCKSKDGNSFLAVWQSYNEVLREYGLRSKEDKVYIHLLLRLFKMKADSWEEKWKVLMEKLHLEHIAPNIRVPLLNPPIDPFVVDSSNKPDFGHLKGRQSLPATPIVSRHSSSDATKIELQAERINALREKEFLRQVFRYMQERARYSQQMSGILMTRAAQFYAGVLMYRYLSAWMNKLNNFRIVLHQAHHAGDMVLVDKSFSRWRKQLHQQILLREKEAQQFIVFKTLANWHSLTTQWKEKVQSLLFKRSFSKWKKKLRNVREKEAQAHELSVQQTYANTFDHWFFHTCMRRVLRVYRTKLCVRVFQQWSLRYSDILNLSKEAKTHYNSTVLKRCWRRWKKKCAQITPEVENALTFNKTLVLRNTFQVWRRQTRLAVAGYSVIERVDTKSLKSVFSFWRLRAKRADQILILADNILLCTFINRWRLRLQEHICCENHEYRLLQKLFGHWLLASKRRRCTRLYETQLLETVWVEWRQRTKRSLQLLSTAQTIDERNRWLCGKKSLLHWRMVVLEHGEQQVIAEERDREKTLRLFWQQWNSRLQNRAGLLCRADDFYDARLQRFVFECWRRRYEIRHQKSLDEQASIYNDHRLKNKAQQCFFLWYDRLQKVHKLDRVQDVLEQRLTTDAFLHWFHRTERIRALSLLAESAYAERLLRSALSMWHYQYQRLVLLQNVSETKHQELTLRTKKRMFDAWQLRFFRTSSLFAQGSRFHERKKSRLVGRCMRRWQSRYRKRLDKRAQETSNGEEDTVSSSYLHAFDTTLPLQNESHLRSSSRFRDRLEQELRTPTTRFSKFLRNPLPPNTR
ncbi:spindle pole body protein Sfi1 [Schizosaccharomyces japonicus yFS275]|uniref:Spindle pole body protein Sfi1 n=1 Tax=Schizosaccharomyces japonicus (strain yFS275 / FY16936) TaxID=402676 RepID=B6K4I3_SCHJY|nr:spindle pole body protein Sfi1 [Schizosaccharomyces japonicus yFS275]EEB08390.1 spindle pole body protein Sfi1 [Schizosaccharomyces japonicus yFS275]